MTVTAINSIDPLTSAIDYCTKCQALIPKSAQWYEDQSFCPRCATYMAAEGFRMHGSRTQGRFWDAARRMRPDFPPELWLWEEFKVVCAGRPFRADFVFRFGPEFKVAVECDSFMHHSSRPALTRDHQRQRAFQREGWLVIRFSGSELWNDPAACVIELIQLVLLEADRRWGTGLAAAA